jgi:hypothetical protein
MSTSADTAPDEDAGHGAPRREAAPEDGHQERREVRARRDREREADHAEAYTRIAGSKRV